MGAARGRHVAEGLIDAVAGALDLETPLPTADAVGLALQAAGPGLLVLDEAEAVAAAAVELTTRWHQAAPQLEVLITSRVLADREPHVTLSVLDPASGATLFQRRAARVRSTEGLDDEGVARVVAALDGLPLAIELAAARLRVLDLEGLRARLGERFALQRDHTRSLEATLHTSWALLSPDEQRVLVAAAAFPGSFTLEAIEEVAGIDALDPLDVLVRASLVVQDGPRWRLLTVLRAFVRQVSPTDEDPAFVAWTAAWTGKRYRAARGGDHRSLLELIDELPTLKAALERAVQPVAHAHLALACALVAEAHGTRTGVRRASRRWSSTRCPRRADSTCGSPCSRSTSWSGSRRCGPGPGRCSPRRGPLARRTASCAPGWSWWPRAGSATLGLLEEGLGS